MVANRKCPVGGSNSGCSFTIRAGNATGAGTATGGDLIIRAGNGTSYYPKNYIDGSNGKVIYCKTKHTYTMLFTNTFIIETPRDD